MAVWERIRNHLESLAPRIGGLTERDTWPEQATQDGIAAAVGINRSHAALELKRQTLLGRVRRFRAHVRGRKQRVLVYRWEKVDRTVFVANGGTHYVTADRVQIVGLQGVCPVCSTEIVLVTKNGTKKEE